MTAAMPDVLLLLMSENNDEGEFSEFRFFVAIASGQVPLLLSVFGEAVLGRVR
jgi:hypothetical protein